MGTNDYVSIRPDMAAIDETLIPAFGQTSRWCVWRVKDRGVDRKPAKVPSNGGKRQISTASPDDWLVWPEARQLYRGGDFEGVGILMASLPGIVGIDVDNCLEDGVVKASSAEVVAAVEAMGSYVEVSPSGTGLRAFVFGALPAGCKEKIGDVEVYGPDSTRYLTVTGVVWSRCVAILENQSAIDDFLARFGFLKSDDVIEPARGGNPAPCRNPAPCGGPDGERWPPVSDAKVLGLLKRNNKRGLVSRLWAGNLEDAGSDHSKADFMLCCQIANYTRDEDQVDRIFQQSGLMREKWSERRGKLTYGAQTIYSAIEAVEKAGDNHWVRQAVKTADTAIERAQVKSIKEKANEFLDGGLDELVDSKGRLRQNVFVWSQLLSRDKRLMAGTWFDDFACHPRKSLVFSQAMGRGFDGEALTDDDYLGAAIWLAREWGLNIRLPDARSALLAWASLDRRNPIASRLDVLASEWDGVLRLDRWLIDYCGASDAHGELSEYLAAIGSRWFIGVVARAYGPAKVDTMLILEGRQGTGKSTAARTLAEAISPACFLEGFELGAGKDALISLRGKLVAEWGELSGLGKHESDMLKNFLSREVDSYRDPYGVTTRDFRRTCCLIGSTNESVYLRDVTGNRRFWPVQVGKIDVARLRLDAGQLWGEAVHRLRQGERWWVGDSDTTGLRGIITREQQARLVPDAWAEVAEDFGLKLASGLVVVEDRPRSLQESWRFIDLARAVLGAERAEALTSADERRLQNALRRAGWENYQSAGRGKWRITSEIKNSLAERVR